MLKRQKIDNEAVDTVKTIFNKYVNEGVGGTRLVRYLYENGVKRLDGKHININNVCGMLQNELYTGWLIFGDTRTFIPELKIIDDDTFYRAQEIRKARAEKRKSGRMPMDTEYEPLLSGIVFCGNCGRRMTFNISRGKWLRANGETAIITHPRYVCSYGRIEPGRFCKPAYSAKKVDEAVRGVLQRLPGQIRETPPADYRDIRREYDISDIRNKIETVTHGISKLSKQLSAYKSEVIKVIQGDSAFTAEILNQLIHDTDDKVFKQTSELEYLKSELDETEGLYEMEKQNRARIRSWSEIFDESSPQAQKMAAASLISAIRINRGYHIEIDFNLSVKEFVESISFDDENISVSDES